MQTIVVTFQDLINTLFHYFPDINYVVPCTSNVRLDYCLSDAVDDSCRQFSTFVGQTSSPNDVVANDVLPFMIHGSRGAFHDNWKLWDLKFFTSYFPNLINWFQCYKTFSVKISWTVCQACSIFVITIDFSAK
jgi:hypothetical protein